MNIFMLVCHCIALLVIIAIGVLWMIPKPYIKFENGTWYNIPGRGLVYATKWPKPLEDRRTLLGATVLIEGIPYKVRNIEHFSHGNNIGLVVSLVID